MKIYTLTCIAIYRIHVSYAYNVPDCASVNGGSGLYLTIQDDIPILVYCEIKSEPTESAYTVIQRRINGNQDFNKNWEEYARGFGNPAGNFWDSCDAFELC